MTPIQLIQDQLNQHNLNDVIEHIYTSLKEKKSAKSFVVFSSKSFLCKDDVQEYLKELLAENNLCEFIDKRHRASEFLEYLFEALSLSTIDYEVTLDDCRDKSRRLYAMKEPYIFVDTNFKRASEPIFVLACLEGSRRIKLDKSLYLDTTKEAISTYISNSIKLHFKWRDGTLPLWGDIRAYLYYDIEGNRTVYNCLGDVIEDDNSIFESRASMSLK